MSESEQTPPPESDFYSEYYRNRPSRPERPPRRREPSGLGALRERAKAWLQSSGAFGQMRVRIGALVALAVAIGFIVWAAVGGGGGSSSSSSQTPTPPNTAAGTGPVALSLGGLKTLAATLQTPIYWLGTKSGMMYELRQLTNGNVYVRYLPSGVAAGDPKALLTIGTYPMQNAYSITQGLGKKAGAVQVEPGHGGTGFYSKSNPTDAYVAFPGSDYQIEVYSPVHGVARKAVARGAVSAVSTGGAPRPGVRAISPAGLRALAKSLGQPVYWAGRRPATRLELTQTSGGRVYVRYLPNGAAVGAPGPYLTVGTYALTNAFAATSALAQGADNRSLKLPGGGIAAYGKGATTTNIYVAYPNSDYQVEVFDPTPGAARRLVASHRIAAFK